MKFVIRLASITVAWICLAGTESIVASAPARAQEQSTQQVATSSSHKVEVEAADVRLLSVDECKRLAKNDALYEDISADMLLPVDQSMPILSSIFGNMLGIPNLQLVVIEGRQAISDASINIGYPTTWFQAVDTYGARRFILANGTQIVSLFSLEIGS